MRHSSLLRAWQELPSAIQLEVSGFVWGAGAISAASARSARCQAGNGVGLAFAHASRSANTAECARAGSFTSTTPITWCVSESVGLLFRFSRSGSYRASGGQIFAATVRPPGPGLLVVDDVPVPLGVRRKGGPHCRESRLDLNLRAAAIFW